jgi:hypothetical protein
MEVRGIGKKIFQKIRSNISLTEGVVSILKQKDSIKKIESKPEVIKEKKETADEHDANNKAI